MRSFIFGHFKIDYFSGNLFIIFVFHKYHTGQIMKIKCSTRKLTSLTTALFQ